jgi:hypothetical protein
LGKSRRKPGAKSSKEKAAELVGQKFSWWTVVAVTERRSSNSDIYLLAKCECGVEREVVKYELTSGRRKSCGKCGIHRKEICVRGHNIEEWGGRTSSNSCRACLKDKALRYNYGISLDEYLKLFELQGGKCAICAKQLTKFTKIVDNTLGRAELDHQHGGKTVDKKYVRGILCGGRWAGCNRKLGRVDNIAWLRAAAEYLTHPPAKQLFLNEAT